MNLANDNDYNTYLRRSTGIVAPGEISGLERILALRYLEQTSDVPYD
jgi:hypothetical protein